MKKIISNVRKRCLVTGVLLLFFVSLFYNSMGVANAAAVSFAKSGDESFTGYETEDSIVQVVLLYQDENSKYYILKSGSGILVDGSTVITNNHLTYLDDAEKTSIGEYLTTSLGKEVSFFATEDDDIEEISYSVAIVEEADIYNMASVSLSSNDWDFAILTLSTPATKAPAVLGKSENVLVDDEVSVVGLPTTTYDAPVSFTVNDVMSTKGQCVSLDNGSIYYNARLEAGNSGGALVDKYGRVIGVTIYFDDGTGIFAALPVDSIKSYLDRSMVQYTEDSRSIEDIEVVPVEIENEFDTDKKELNRVIMEAELIYEEGNDGIYTEDSFRNLRLNLDYAKITYDDPEATQEVIDTDTENLRTAIDGLVKVEKDNNIMIIIVACSAGGILLILLVVLIICKSIKKKREREEAQKIKLMSESTSNESTQKKFEINTVVTADSASSQLYAQFNERNSSQGGFGDVYGDDGQIASNDYEGTTILNDYSKRSITGYLYKRSTQNYIVIEGDEFVIGKGVTGVDYTITDNNTVSRQHAKILRKYDDFFVEDLGSTNCTYVNGSRVAPGYKQILYNNDVLTLSDEEFVFMISN